MEFIKYMIRWHLLIGIGIRIRICIWFFGGCRLQQGVYICHITKHGNIILINVRYKNQWINNDIGKMRYENWFKDMSECTKSLLQLNIRPMTYKRFISKHFVELL